MTQKGEIFKTVDDSMKALSKALEEREEALRMLLYAQGVTKADDLDDIESYRLGAELESQIEVLNDLIKELKFQMKYIGIFKEV